MVKKHCIHTYILPLHETSPKKLYKSKNQAQSPQRCVLKKPEEEKSNEQRLQLMNRSSLLHILKNTTTSSSSSIKPATHQMNPHIHISLQPTTSQPPAPSSTQRIESTNHRMKQNDSSI